MTGARDARGRFTKHRTPFVGRRLLDGLILGLPVLVFIAFIILAHLLRAGS